jgi:hypothetical protein
MSLDDSRLADWEAMQRKHGRQFVTDPELPLKGGAGGGTYDPMEGRVAKLEAYMDVTRDDLKDIKVDIRAVKDGLSHLATKNDLETWKWQWVFIALAVIALTVTGIVGGLSLIAHAAK